MSETTIHLPVMDKALIGNDDMPTINANMETYQKQVSAEEKKQLLTDLTIKMNGTVFQANATSQGRLLAKIVAMTRRAETECQWRDANNNNISTTLVELVALSDAIETRLEELILM